MAIKYKTMKHKDQSNLGAFEEVHVEGWKGKDTIEIEAHDEDFLLIEHRKDKESGEVKTSKHVVFKENVDKLWAILNKNCSIGIKYNYRDLIREIISERQLGCDVDSFNGGRWRAKAYFPFYYWCCKILEAQKKIQYLGRGGVVRLC